MPSSPPDLGKACDWAEVGEVEEFQDLPRKFAPSRTLQIEKKEFSPTSPPRQICGKRLDQHEFVVSDDFYPDFLNEVA